MPLITRAGTLRYIGGRRFGAWLSRNVCADHRRECSGITRGPRFLELSARGRSVGLCW